MASERFKAEEVIKAIQATGGVKAIIAKRLGCHRHTIDNYIKRYATVRQAYEAEREEILDVAESRLVQKIHEGFWPAIRFALCTLGKDRGYYQKKGLDIKAKDIDAAIEVELKELATASQGRGQIG